MGIHVQNIWGQKFSFLSTIETINFVLKNEFEFHQLHRKSWWNWQWVCIRSLFTKSITENRVTIFCKTYDLISTEGMKAYIWYKDSGRFSWLGLFQVYFWQVLTLQRLHDFTGIKPLCKIAFNISQRLWPNQRDAFRKPMIWRIVLSDVKISSEWIKILLM